MQLAALVISSLLAPNLSLAAVFVYTTYRVILYTRVVVYTILSRVNAHIATRGGRYI